MSLNLVTAHTGSAHITAEQVASLIKGAISDDTTNLYRFQTGNKCEYQITDALQVQILTGDAVFNGRHFIVEETETIDIDPTSLNYTRIDGVFLEIYSDNDTSEELIRFEVVQGNEYLTSTGTPSYPATPTGIDDSHTLMYVFPWLYITTSYTTISTVEDNSKLYPNVLDITGDIDDINTEIESMKETFQDGVDLLYNDLVIKGVTPPSSTPEGISEGIDTYGSSQYTTGYNNGYGYGYSLGKAHGLLEGALSVSIKAMTATAGGTTTAGGYTYLSINTNNPGASIGAITKVGTGLLYDATITSVSNGVVNVRINSDAGYPYSIQATTYKLVSDYLPS